MKKTEESPILKVLEAINKNLGNGIAYVGDEKDEVDVIPTGILPLDYALGCGGIPRGRITDIFGMESAGKSTLCYIIIAAAQKMGISCGIVDAENSFIPEYAQHHGVDTSNLLVVSPDCFEDGAEAIEAMVRGGIGCIVIDSVSSMVPRPEAEAEHGKSPMAIQARLMSQMMRKLVTPIGKFNTALICINQMRANLLSTNPGDRYTVTGGFALKFYSSIRIKVSRVGALMDGKKQHIGYTVGFRVVKNKIATPGGNCEVPYRFDTGYERDGDIVTMALERGIFTRDGNTVLYKGEKLGRGHETATEFLKENAELRQEVISLIFPPAQR